MKNLKISVLFVCLLCSSACGVQQAKQAINSEKQSTLAQKPKATPKNIILMIGDGMGISQITAGMYSNNNYLELERCTHIGLHKQHASDNLITDSAAGATVFSIGRKSNKKAIIQVMIPKKTFKTMELTIYSPLLILPSLNPPFQIIFQQCLNKSTIEN